MLDADLVKVREYYLVQLVNARQAKNLDTQLACIEWVVSLTSEVRIRSGAKLVAARDQPKPQPLTQMSLRDMFEMREARIVGLVSAHRAHDSDAMEESTDAIVALMFEMRLRGSQKEPENTITP
jgi:hypothetical protein